VIRAGAIWATGQSATLFVALAVQIVALFIVGDVFFSAPRVEAARSIESVARVAPLARGERLMTADVFFDRIRDTTPAPATETVSEPTGDVALAQSADLALAPAAELAPPSAEPAPDPSAVAELVPDPTPKPTPAPTTRPAPPAPASQTSAATHEAELRMLGLMNLSRVNAGLAPLALDAGVSEAARKHSAVEAQHRYVYHDGPDGTAGSRYVPACGSGWYGENTGKVWGGGVDVLHREFMAEPWVPINHRTNIMDPNFRRAGIGAVQGPDAIYITVAFCR
jgi:uncharacterized protein YkwD